ncbi:hypothetical protein SELMODRAFT_425884 [Selaginella moellendorffii]|uniref:Uncharacterized protein n=1 Tax=Selaginella moellendorffii TaxID=88036 RepID=D8SUL9_SELML|nr:hypothetical protein SELMODRAFT_425884 [Selaginella moellendorffii]
MAHLLDLMVLRFLFQHVAFAKMCEFDLKSILSGEPTARERVCQTHILIDKVWPTPKEVYIALVQGVMEGPSSVREVSKSKRDAHHRGPSVVCRSAVDSFRESDGHSLEDAEPEIFKKKQRKANDSGATKSSKFMMKDQAPEYFDLVNIGQLSLSHVFN